MSVYFVFAFPDRSFSPDDYVVGPEDEINTVWDHPDLTRKIRINLEGKNQFSSIGEVKVRDSRLSTLEKKIEELLNKDYIINPQVTVVIESYKSSNVSIMGEGKDARLICPYPEDDRGGGPFAGRRLLSEADHEIMIVRPKKAIMPMAPSPPKDVDESEIIRIQIRDVLQREGGGRKGKKYRGKRNGDTIFVPRARMFYVTVGEVNKPSVCVSKGHEPLHAISTAGGFTEKARRSKIKVVRESREKS